MQQKQYGRTNSVYSVKVENFSKMRTEIGGKKYFKCQRSRYIQFPLFLFSLGHVLENKEQTISRSTINLFFVRFALLNKVWTLLFAIFNYELGRLPYYMQKCVLSLINYLYNGLFYLFLLYAFWIFSIILTPVSKSQFSVVHLHN